MGLRMHLLGGHKSTLCICPFRECAEGLKRWFSVERVLAALPEVLSSTPGTHIQSPTTTVAPAPEDLMLSSGLCRYQALTCMQPHMDIHAHT